MPGPLESLVVVELAGLGPGPFCGMVLADLGATVLRVDRPPGGRSVLGDPATDLHNRGKQSIAVDLKHESGVEVVLRCVEAADALIEGFRPGVAERLGVGPAACLARRPSLVYGRMTGWGQTGPMAEMAGHDIDYIALSGALHAVGPEEQPFPPLNLVGDFGGGGMVLAVGILAAVFHARQTGEGQVIDSSMVEGSALLTTSHHGLMNGGWWLPMRQANLLDGGAPFYSTYRTLDGRHMAVGALEPQFFSALLEGLGLASDDVGEQNDRNGWGRMREIFAERFATRTRDEWTTHFAETDACVAPVLSLGEAPDHPHNRDRSSFIEVEGVLQPGPAPRFDRTPAAVTSGPARPGADTDAILGRLGFSPDEVGKLRRSGAVA